MPGRWWTEMNFLTETKKRMRPFCLCTLSCFRIISMHLNANKLKPKEEKNKNITNCFSFFRFGFIGLVPFFFSFIQFICCSCWHNIVWRLLFLLVSKMYLLHESLSFWIACIGHTIIKLKRMKRRRNIWNGMKSLN